MTQKEFEVLKKEHEYRRKAVEDGCVMVAFSEAQISKIYENEVVKTKKGIIRRLFGGWRNSR